MVCSLAALERLKEERPKAIDNCVATAGFSLGEITALVFAGAMPFDKGKPITSYTRKSKYYLPVRYFSSSSCTGTCRSNAIG